jgi:hypothetical protein
MIGILVRCGKLQHLQHLALFGRIWDWHNLHGVLMLFWILFLAIIAASRRSSGNLYPGYFDFFTIA